MRTPINLGRVQVYEFIFKLTQNYFEYAKGAQKVDLEKSLLHKYLSKFNFENIFLYSILQKFGFLQIETCAGNL